MVLESHSQALQLQGQTQGLPVKGVNTIPEVVLVWPVIRYISDIGQYRCTVLGLPLFFIFINIYIYIYVCVCVCVCVCVL